MRVEVTGGTGLMGKELQKIMPGIYLGHHDIEIRDEDSVKRVFAEHQPDLVVHLAADVRTDGANKQETYDTNVIGTRNVANHCRAILYMSTEYVFDGEKGNYTEEDYPNPLQFYGFTKLLGEYEAQRCQNSVILRGVFKPRPYKHPVVPTGMRTSGDYVDVMAGIIKEAVERYSELPPILNIGTGTKLLKDLALQTRNVGDINIQELPVKIPLDTSLDLTKWNALHTH